MENSKHTPSDPFALITEGAGKFGWTVKKTDKGYELFNRKEIKVVDIEEKKGKYKFVDTIGNKLMTANGKPDQATEKLIETYYYGQRISTMAKGGSTNNLIVCALIDDKIKNKKKEFRISFVERNDTDKKFACPMTDDQIFPSLTKAKQFLVDNQAQIERDMNWDIRFFPYLEHMPERTFTNKYEGKSSEEIWNAWDVPQREHFLLDHIDVIELPAFGIRDYAALPHSELPEQIKTHLEEHRKHGQYGKGGQMKFVEAKKFNGEQYYTIGEDDGEKALYNEQEKKLVQDGYHIELELRASRNPKDKMEEFLKDMQSKKHPEATLVLSDNEFGAYWRIYTKGATESKAKGGSVKSKAMYHFSIDEETASPAGGEFIASHDIIYPLFSDSKSTAQSYQRRVMVFYPNVDELKTILNAMSRQELDRYAKRVFKWNPDSSLTTEELINDEIIRNIEQDCEESYYTDRNQYIEKSADAIKEITGKSFSPYREVGKIVKCEITMKNPLIFDADETDDITTYDVPQLIADAKEAGNDGVLIKNGNCNAMFTDKGEDLEPSNCAIPFSANQIKVVDDSGVSIAMPEELAKGGNVGSGMSDAQIEQALATLTYFPKESITNTRKILHAVRTKLTGQHTSLASGGGFEHLFVQLNDKRWLGFHWGTGAVTVSEKKYDTASQVEEAMWDEEDPNTLYTYSVQAAINDEHEYFDNWKEIADDIKADKFVKEFGKGGGTSTNTSEPRSGYGNHLVDYFLAQ